VTVIPKDSREHEFEAAQYSYSHEKNRDAQRYFGVSSNKPNKAEILSKREYILKSSWHFVSYY